MRLQRLHQGVGIQAQHGDLLRRELEVDFLVLHADEIDLGHVADAQQLCPNPLGLVPQLPMREAVGRQRIDQRIGIPELVVTKRTRDPGRERVRDVTNLLAHLIPQARHGLRIDGILQIDEHHQLAGLGIAPHVVEIRQLLELLLDPVRHLLQGLGRRGTLPERFDHHGLDGERRVFLAAELAVGPRARDSRDEHQIDDKAFVANGPVGKVEAGHGASPSAKCTR